jgi:molecular chaperone IbpA
MRTFDFSPLYRSTVGFDRLSNLVDAASKLDDRSSAYPPYNIEVTGDNSFRISVAVAGFSANELDIQSQENTLTISGKHKDDSEDRHYLHRGIAGRSFDRRFQLADHVHVANAATANGLLHVDLVREIPEEQRPRRIEIKATNSPEIEGETAH